MQCSFAQKLIQDENVDLLTGRHPVCTKKKCIFQEADNRYTLKMKKGMLTRERDGQNQYTRKILENGDKINAAALSDYANVLAVAIINRSLSRRAFSNKAHPDDLDRSFRIALYNPKSGSLIKAFDLGAFASKTISLSGDGQLVFTVGHDLERRKIKEVRVYNARSGQQIHSRDVEEIKSVRLYSNGYTHAGQAWTIARTAVGEVAIYNSRDPFSIAEYQITCSSVLSAKSMPRQHSIGVLPAMDKDQQENWIATLGILVKLRENGFNTVERKGMKKLLEELQLNMSGLFDANSGITNIGRLLSATHFIFSDIRQEENNILLNSRLVTVTTSEIGSTCNMICRDCRPQDFFEGVSAVAGHWIGKAADE